MKLVILGLGGIGTQLLPPLMQYLNHEERKLFQEIVLLDGDKFEEHNSTRQYFDSLGYKAEVTANHYRNLYSLPITCDTEYLSERNIHLYIKDGDVVMSGVDNNATRLMLEKYIDTLDNITVISGGNHYWDGNVVITQKRKGQYTTPKFSDLHPELLTPKDHNPADIGCDVQVKEKGSGQLGLVNASIANYMRTALLGLINNRLQCHEIFVDCLTGGTRVINNELEGFGYRELGLKEKKGKRV